MNCFYSIVIPLKNEAGNINALIEEIEPVMNNLGKPWELICIDDGSTDRTREILNALASQKPYLRPIFFTKNFGQSSAFEAGFKHAQGTFVITLDGDGQNDPKDIPALLAFTPEYDLVCGSRVKRKDSFIKRLNYRCANIIRSRLCDDGVEDTGCSLKVYRKQCLDQIKLFHGLHRFLPALFKIEGFSIKEIPVNHRERLRGKSNYNFFNRSFNTVADLLAVLWMKKRHLHYKIENH